MNNCTATITIVPHTLHLLNHLMNYFTHKLPVKEGSIEKVGLLKILSTSCYTTSTSSPV